MANAVRLSTSEFIAETLRREIVQGEALPGQALQQDQLAVRFDVSQSSVREALRRLEGLGLVESFRNRGVAVSRVTVAQVEEMYEIRLVIERLALRTAFPHLTPERLQRARQILEAQTGELSFVGEAHQEFHRLFYASPDRKVAEEMLRTLFGNLTRAWIAFAKQRPSLARDYEPRSRREHLGLVEAAEANDLSAAERVLEAHVCGARDLLLAHLREIEAEAGATRPPERRKRASAA